MIAQQLSLLYGELHRIKIVHSYIKQPVFKDVRQDAATSWLALLPTAAAAAITSLCLVTGLARKSAPCFIAEGMHAKGALEGDKRFLCALLFHGAVQL